MPGLIDRSRRGACIGFLALLLGACSTQQPFDPVVMDPPPDPAHPASMDGIRIASHGAMLNGRIYEAAGEGPHPTLLMFHGFPGSELNLDLAQAVRRAGWNAVMFHYRGTWGSEGAFGLHHILEDASAVLDAIRAPEFAKAHRIDPARVSVFGHSMGGFVALMTGATHPELRCTTEAAAANFALLAPSVAADPKLAAMAAATFQSWGEGPIADMSGERMVAEVIKAAGEFDFAPRAAALVSRPVQLIVAERDDIAAPAQNHAPLLAMLQAANGRNVRELRLDADHAFDGARIALARGVVDFLQTNCR